MITVNELFAGIGSQSAALERLGVDFKVVGIAEIDKYAIKSYEAIHGPVRNYGDISKIEKLDYADFWTYSFPCQDISVAGKQRGINENTRSGLLYEVERLLYRSIMYGEQPKYLMLENVKNLVGKQFKPQFEAWIKRLDELGYNTYWKVLNAKNYGIPQNRERVFAISIRKDIDTGYDFPVGFDNGKRLKDILESEVDEKFYLSTERMNILKKNIDMDRVNEKSLIGSSQKHASIKDDGICTSLTSAMGWGGGQTPMVVGLGENNCIVSADLNHYRNDQMNRVYNIDGISPTITVVSGGGREQKVLIPQVTKQGYIECNIPGVADLSFPDSKTRRGRVQENGEIYPTLTAGTQDICYIDTPCIVASRGRNPQNPSDRTVGSPTEQRLEINKNGTSNTITTVQKDNYVLEPKFRIRKLTPLEVWRLMGFADEQFYKASEVNSNSQLYKQAGNSICVDVLYYLFENLFLEN